MIKWLARFSLLALVAYFAGMIWFINAPPGPAEAAERTDGIVVLTGGPGRLARGFALLREGAAERMLISGVDASVRPEELAAEYNVPMSLMSARVDLGRGAVDTRGNGEEVASWVERHDMGSIRIVTNDWHMRRARKEIGWRVKSGTQIVADGVISSRTFGQMFVEYNKFLISPFGERLGLE